MESAAVNAPDSFCFYVMINIENISISFGNLTLFRGLDLQVHYGESVCICGGSGSGKSSLLKAVLGFVPLSEGTIKVDGTLLAPRTADHIRKKRGYYGIKQSRNKSKETHVIPLIHRYFFDLISFISLTVKNLFLVHFCCTFVTRNKIIFITLTSEKPEWGIK